MSTDIKNQDESVETDGEEGAAENEKDDRIYLAKDEYDKLKSNEATVGSLKRELKDLKKSLETAKEGTDKTSKNQTEEFGLLQKTYLRAAGVVAEDEIELAKEIQKKTGIDWDKLVDDDYFQGKLQKLKDAKANADALNMGRGGRAPSSDAKTTVSYWLQQNNLPSDKDIPDRKKRAALIREITDTQKNAGGTFYNE